MFKKQQFDWTDDRVKTLVDAINNMVTFSKVAEMLGTSKNSVAGKVSRLRDEGVLPESKSGNPSYFVLKPVAKNSSGTVSGVRFEDLKRGQCRFELNGHRDLPTDFCGGETGGKSPYCEKHHRMCYRKVSE